jgi:hypothetical protein
MVTFRYEQKYSFPNVFNGVYTRKPELVIIFIMFILKNKAIPVF